MAQQMLPGLGQVAQALADASSNAAAGSVQGIGKQVIQAMYDILGAYPRENVLPYAYSLSNTTVKGNALTANGTIENNIKISSDAAFVACKVTGSSTGNYSLLLRLGGSDRVLMNEAVHDAAYVGTAERPSILPKPMLIQANSVLNATLADLSGAPNEVYLTFIGFKVYNWQNYGPVA
jgi:hypothetical protein